MRGDPHRAGLAVTTELAREIWLARRLRDHGARIFDGVTDRDVRRERFRAAILAHGLEHVVIGRDKDRKPVTYAQAFERLFGEPLVGRPAKPAGSAAGKNSTETP